MAHQWALRPGRFGDARSPAGAWARLYLLVDHGPNCPWAGVVAEPKALRGRQPRIGRRTRLDPRAAYYPQYPRRRDRLSYPYRSRNCLVRVLSQLPRSGYPTPNGELGVAHR